MDGLSDIVTTPAASTYSMYGGNDAKVGTTVYSPVQDSWFSYATINRIFADSDGMGKYNGDDLTIDGTISAGSDGYYDQNGWLTVKVWSDGTWIVDLITDQFDITFDRTLTAVTDGNGAYSFSSLPAGNYSLTFDKAAYNTLSTSGSLGMGQILNLSDTVHPALVLTTATLPDGYLGGIYNQTIAVSGGHAPYSWSVTGGSLPAGLSLDTSTGAITGVPSAIGSSSFAVQVTDVNNATASKTFTIAVNSPLAITTAALVDGYLGSEYVQAVEAAGGKSPYIWSVIGGSLPVGLILNASTGAITGTPTAGGTSHFTVQVTDVNNATVNKSLTIAVYSPLVISTAGLFDGYQGRAYSQVVAAAGGKAPYNWSVTGGSLPTGLNLDTSTGTISGTPGAIGSSSFTIQAKDANNSVAAKTFTIVAYSLPAISTSSLPDGTVGSAYSQTLAAAGGKSPLSWSITAGSLPSGLSLDVSSGAISGTPSVAGTTSFTAQVTDANAIIAVMALSINVVPPPFLVRNLGDTGTVTVMEVTGNYDGKNADGSVNDKPRQAIAREYFSTHGDLDFLVMLSTFDYAMPESEVKGFYLEVKNDTQGIGKPPL